MRNSRSEKRSEAEPLTEEELAALKAEPLPNRESMSTLDPLPNPSPDDVDVLMPSDPIPKP